jgi:hypothetical protein
MTMYIRMIVFVRMIVYIPIHLATFVTLPRLVYPA